MISTSYNTPNRQNFKANPIKIQAQLGSLADTQADIVILNLFRGTRSYGGATGAINNAMGGDLGRAIEKRNFMGELGETMVVNTEGKIQAPKILVVGLGKLKFFGLSSIEKASAQVIKKCENMPGIKNLSTLLHGAGCGGLTAKDCAKALTKGTLSIEDPRQVESLSVIEIDSSKISQIEKGIQEVI